MEPQKFFAEPNTTDQKHYEALRAFYHDGLKASVAAEKFGLSPKYFKKLRFEFASKLRSGLIPFFTVHKTGPKKRLTSDTTINRIVSLRKQNYSVVDIKVALDAESIKISIDTIDKILKAEGFAPLPKRTRDQRLSVSVPHKLKAPKSVALEVVNEEFITEFGAGPLVFLPLIEEIGLVEAIKKCNFPDTKDLHSTQTILSFLALKLLGGLRWSHDTKWNMDRGLGLFAGLNVLPKSTTLSTYSYRTTRIQHRDFLIEACRIFQDKTRKENGEFNLDFKTIPHWGDKSVLEKNWSGARSKAMKSILALIVQDPCTENLSYTNAEIRHSNQSDAIFDFIDFWKQGRGTAPKMLIFDSKFTTYKSLNSLNQSKEKIKFLTIRRRGKNLIEKALNLPRHEWQYIGIKRGKKLQKIRVHDGATKLRHYKGDVRQIIITDHGRKNPTFLITNDFDLSAKELVEKYARRWLVEQEIAEQVIFFNLNKPSSSIVVKVDFDLTLSLIAHNLYRIFSSQLPGFEHCNAPTISRKFLETGALVKIKGNRATINLKKKTHLPILFEIPWMQKTTHISWLNLNVEFAQGVLS